MSKPIKEESTAEEGINKKKTFSFFSSLWNSVKDTLQTIKENPWKSLAIGITSILVPPVGIALATVVGVKTIANVISDLAEANPGSKVGKFVKGVKESTVGRFVSGAWGKLKEIDKKISSGLKPIMNAMKKNPRSVGATVGLWALTAFIPPALPLALIASGIAAYQTHKTYKKQAAEAEATKTSVASVPQQRPQLQQQQNIAQPPMQVHGQVQPQQLQAPEHKLKVMEEQLAATNQKLAEMTEIMKKFQQRSTASRSKFRVTSRAVKRPLKGKQNSRY